MMEWILLSSLLAAGQLVNASSGATSDLPEVPGTVTSTQQKSQDQLRSLPKSSAAPVDVTAPSPKQAPATPSDRFTNSDDRKLGFQLRSELVEMLGAQKANGITLVIDQGDVKLSGKVETEAQRQRINELVKGMKGVKSLTSRLELNK